MALFGNIVLSGALLRFRFNATQIAGLHQALIHERERSGAAWMLEWMILPQISVTTGRALRAAQDLYIQIERIACPTGS